MKPRVAILLSTYNGERFLAEQLDSLIAQSYQNLLVVIRDDHSRDDTVKIIRSYVSRYPRLVHFVADGGSNLGPSASFSFLADYVLTHHEALGMERVYLFFCDQDDVWAPQKVENQMRCLLELEATDPRVPVLIHGDLRVVSESREQIAPSFVRYQGLEPHRDRFGRVLVRNMVTGCSLLMNEPLARLSLPVPEQAIMHDWWVALVASAFGRLVFIDNALLDYRQHDANTLGAIELKPVEGGLLGAPGRLLRKPWNPFFGQLARQAEIFAARYRAELGVRQKSRLWLTSWLGSRSAIIQYLGYRISLLG